MRAPTRGLPSLQMMLDDIPASTEEICKTLQIHPATMRRYIRAGVAPMPVMLSLFWETRWGVSEIHCEAHNAAVQAAGHLAMLKRSNDALRRTIAALEAELAHQDRAANSPIYLVM